MPDIVIKNMNELELQVARTNTTVLHVFHENHVDWMHACGMKGRCTTCKFKIVSGSECLAQPTPAENRFIKLGQLRDRERLACQANLLSGTLNIEVPDTCKLPHVDYSY